MMIWILFKFIVFILVVVGMECFLAKCVFKVLGQYFAEEQAGYGAQGYAHVEEVHEEVRETVYNENEAELESSHKETKTVKKVCNDHVNKTIWGLSFSVWQGIIERVFLSIGLILGLQQVLTLFGALKIGTRLGTSSTVKNHYFLIGNLITVGVAILYYFIFKVCFGDIAIS
ncbi:MAG: hypothetical protein KBC57_05255 [Neisseriaceae bacterium]|nr:hypothetical protein [Neisseriaceae bacterium]